jgi:hypothetical protein
MVPAEVVAVFLCGRGFLEPGDFGYGLGWSIFCLMLVVLSRASATSDKRNGVPPEWPAVAIASGAYLIWIYSLGGEPFVTWKAYSQKLGALLVLGYTAVAPLVYRPR